MFFEYDNVLWENIQSDLLMGIDREVPGNLIEIISHPAAYELHYQDTFGNLYDYTILKSEVFCNYLSYDNLVDILYIFTFLDKGKIKTLKHEFGKECIKVFDGNLTYCVPYKEVEQRFIKKLENEKKLKLNIIIEEEKMEPYAKINAAATNNWDCGTYASYVSPITDRKQIIYQRKKVKTKYQTLIKDVLGIDPKFVNRFYKKVDAQDLTIYNYENKKNAFFKSYIEGIDRQFQLDIRNEEDETVYEYVLTNPNEFITWVNSLHTYSIEDYVAVNKLNPRFELRDVIFFVRDPATIDDKIFNDMWDLLTPEQKMTYLTNNVEKQNLVHKGVITQIKSSLCDYDNTICYSIYDTNLNRDVTIDENHIFTSSVDAIKYLVEDSIAKNKKD